MSTIGQKLRRLLANNEMTQADLGELMSVTADAVSSWVRDINHISLEDAKKLCDIFSIPIQDFTNEEYDIPEYIEVARYLPYPYYLYPEEDRDTIHILIDADLAKGAVLHRFTNAGGARCSAIYYGKTEVWWHYRENEARMIREWNERCPV